MGKNSIKKNEKKFTKGMPYATQVNEKNKSKANVLSPKDIKRVRKTESEEIYENIFIPGRVHVDKKNGDTTVWFEDGRFKIYDMEYIIDILESRREAYMMRLDATVGALLSKYIKKNSNESLFDINCEGYSDFEERMDEIDKLVNRIYEDAENKANTPEQKEKIMIELYHRFIGNDFYCTIYLLEYVIKLYKGMPRTDDFVKDICSIEKQCSSFIKKLDKIEKENNLYHYINEMVDGKSLTSTNFEEAYGGKPLSDESIINIMANMLDSEGIKKYIEIYGTNIIERKSIVKYLVDKQIISDEEIKDIINNEQVLLMYFESKNKNLLKYINKNDIVKLYDIGKIDFQTLKKYADLEAVLNSDIDKDKKMQILTKSEKVRIFNKTETSLIWNLFEQDYLSAQDVRSLEELRYMHIDTLIKNYRENQKRKIAVEMGELPKISDEKVYQFFLPNMVLKDLEGNISDERKSFYCNELKNIYQKFESDLEKEVSKAIQIENGNNKKVSDAEQFALYKSEFLSPEVLGKAEIQEENALRFVEQNETDTNIIIDFFNNGILSQDAVYELYGDEFDDKVMELIANGMSASIIGGLYSTPELIEKVKNGELEMKALKDLKSDIVTGLYEAEKGGKTLVKMYMDEQLSYSELYSLAEAKIISEEEADSINEKYNLKKDLEKLRKVGVTGVPIEQICLNQQENKMFNFQNADESKINSKNKKATLSGETVGIDRHAIYDFYKALGATEVIPVDPDQCPVFKGYNLILIENKKVGFLESEEGRTYILPLKIILEQIKNPKGQLDLIGNAVSRTQFNENDKYVRGANHIKNWATNILKKTAELSPAMSREDITAFKINNEKLIHAIEQSYEKRKMEKSQKFL